MLSTHRFVQHRARAIVALLALAAAALVLAACGGSDGGSGGGSSADAETLLRQTFTGTHDIRSGRADIELTVEVGGDPTIRGPIELGISGPFQSAGSDRLPQFDLGLDVSAQGQSFEAGLTSTSDRMFVRFGGTAYEVPSQLMDQIQEGFARSQEEGSSDPQLDLRSLGLDPMSWLQDPTVEGSESVGGVETDHISAQLDVSALLDDVDVLLGRVSEQGLAGVTGSAVPDSIPADTRQQIEDAVKTATIDVWSGQDDHTLRRLSLDLAIEPPESSEGPDSLDISLTVELTDLNEPQTITAPATTRPLGELLSQFQGLLGGALGGGLGGSGSSGSGSSGAPSADDIDAYSRCIQDAAGDVAEAQKCASLLTP